MQRFKSCQFRVGGEIPCRKFLIWPHDLCYVGVDCKHLTRYVSMWSCGFVRSVLKQPSTQAQLNMLFAAELYQNALDLGWPIARGAYKVILTEMEAGRVSWSNLQAIQALRHNMRKGALPRL